jgi:lipopolysaccharide/colanic/teichoic acid biosynthesis glycosyltransferase
VPTLTFAATANAVLYTGARPVFVDCDPATGNIDAELLARTLGALRRDGQRIAAAIPVDMFGKCAAYDAVGAVCAAYEVPMVEDAAEALGATYHGRPAGSFGRAAVLSFNGNKVLTTSSGGMVLSGDGALVQRCRYLASQARQPVVHYEHTELGFNYRLSNVLAALGQAQLRRLDAMLKRRRDLRERYRDLFAGVGGVEVLGGADDGEDNCRHRDPAAVEADAPPAAAPGRARDAERCGATPVRDRARRAQRVQADRGPDRAGGGRDPAFPGHPRPPASGAMTGYDAVKRGCDVVAGSLLLVLTAPLLALVAVAVAWDLGRPVLFRQPRPGLHGDMFELVKLRSMRTPDPARGLVTDADRLTRLGRFVRSTSLDELPTLWNVVRGDMSLVGPRPLLPAYLGHYTAEQARRHEVRPGVTGVVQVSGRNRLTWPEKLALDVWYVDHRSFWLDARILLATVRAVLLRTGISADGEATMPELWSPT